MFNSMKKAGLFAAAVFAGSAAFAQLPTKVVSGNITANRTFVNDTIYQLDGFVYVKNNATLTIEAGTIVQGYINAQNVNTKGTLIITRAGMIDAQGTECQPIVFTSARPAGSRGTGDWGGIIILGEAPINPAGGTAIIEGGLTGDVNDRTYGGQNPNDNSGIMKYCRIEYSGIAFTANNEINSLTMGGVGAGTQIDYIQVSFAGDDAYEWFGGNNNHKYLIAIGIVDDNFDCDFGYSGKVQYGFVKQFSGIADISQSEGWETDNDGTGTGNTPLTSPKFANVTIVGPEADGGPVNALHQRAARIRRNSRTAIFNSVIMEHKVGLRWESSGTQNAVRANTTGIYGSVFSGNTANYASEGTFSTIDSVAKYVEMPSRGNTVFAVGGASATELGLPADYYSQTGCSHTTNNGSILRSGAAWTYPGVSGDPFFDNVAFRGAFGATNWAETWAEWNPQTMVYTFGAVTRAPQSVAVAFTSKYNFTVTYSAVAGATGYNVQFREVGSPSWSNRSAAGTSKVITVPGPGDYEVRVGALVGNCYYYSCPIEFTADCFPVNAGIVVFKAPFCATSPATYRVNFSGGVGTKTFLWSTGATTRSITVAPGTYSCTVTDVYGCDTTVSITSSAPAGSFESTTLVSVIKSGANFTVNWNPKVIPGATVLGYRAGYRLQNSGSPFTNSPLLGGTSHVFNLSSECNGNYEFTVTVRYQYTAMPAQTSAPACSISRGHNFGPCKGEEGIAANDAANSLSVYPNPTSGDVFVALNGEETMVEVLDINGRVVMSNVFNGVEAQLNIAELANGMYIVRATAGNEVATAKIVKE
ncbi:T9SS type A sorting domain-containing protein [bacterium]|nr:T9SS type A sorting domain-containing protein [bacterium]